METITKTGIESIIETKAKRMFDETLRDALRFINNNDFLKKVVLTVDSENIYLENVIHRMGTCDTWSEKFNARKIKQSIIDEYIKQESELLISQISQLSEYFIHNS